MNEEYIIPKECPCCGYINVTTRSVCNAGIAIRLRKKNEQQAKRISELEGKIQNAKNIVDSQSFWCELAKQECVGLKSIVHLVKQALKGE